MEQTKHLVKIQHEIFEAKSTKHKSVMNNFAESSGTQYYSPNVPLALRAFGSMRIENFDYMSETELQFFIAEKTLEHRILTVLLPCLTNGTEELPHLEALESLNILSDRRMMKYKFSSQSFAV